MRNSGSRKERLGFLQTLPPRPVFVVLDPFFKRRDQRQEIERAWLEMDSISSLACINWGEPRAAQAAPP